MSLTELEIPDSYSGGLAEYGLESSLNADQEDLNEGTSLTAPQHHRARSRASWIMKRAPRIHPSL